MKLRTILVLAGLCFGQVACAWTEDRIDVSYAPAAPFATVSNASNVHVAVSGQDARTSYRDRVSSKINGFGTEAAPIYATNDVVALTRQSIEQGLAARGFAIGDGGARVEVDVMKFYNRFNTGFWAGSSNSEITLAVRVLNPAGGLRFARTYAVEAADRIQLASGENARTTLSKALADAVARVVNDPELVAALMPS